MKLIMAIINSDDTRQRTGPAGTARLLGNGD